MYFDHASTTYVIPEVADKMSGYLSSSFANPSSVHLAGLSARRAVDQSIDKIAISLNCSKKSLLFTSGGTESNNFVLKGVLEKHDFKGHVITTAIEHHSVFYTLRYLETRGVDVTYLPVDSSGIVNVEDVKKAIRKDTVLISIMYANNEIGTIQPIEAISKIAKDNNVLFHTDAVQAVGLLHSDIQKLGVDFLSMSGHKIYGPKGVGVLFVKDMKTLVPQMHGGSQQYNMRAGTYNVTGIIGVAEALFIAKNSIDHEVLRLTELRDYIIEYVLKNIPETILTGSRNLRLPNNAHFCFADIDGGSLLMRLSNKEISLSNGSACTAGAAAVSHVVEALRIPERYANGSIRISLGKRNSLDDVRKLCEILEEEVTELRKL